MAISSMFQRAVNLIPSVASTAKNGFTRVLSFTGSFNDRTSLLLAAAPEPVPDDEQEPTHPPSPPQEAPPPAPPVTTSVAFDIEAATPPETLAGGEEAQETAAQDAEAKRVAKTVQTVCLFAASASLVLFVNLPSKPTTAVHDHEAEERAGGVVSVLYSVDMAFICLSLFTSLGLSMFSIVARPGTDAPAVARVQKHAMVMAVAFVLVSFTLRMCMMLPPATVESSAWLVFVLLAGAVAVYLALARKFGHGRGSAEIARGSASAADRV